MRSTGSGPLGALLMLAPLIAVPILAVVGIPQFAPGNLIDQNGSKSRKPGREYRAPEEPDVGEDSRGPDDLFQSPRESDLEDFDDPLPNRKKRPGGLRGKGRGRDLDPYETDLPNDETDAADDAEPQESDFESDQADRRRGPRRPAPKDREPKGEDEEFGQNSTAETEQFFDSEPNAGKSNVDERNSELGTENRVAPPFVSPNSQGKTSNRGSKVTGSRTKPTVGRNSKTPDDKWLATPPPETPDNEPSQPQSSPAADDSNRTDELTWQSATKRLRKLGVGARKQYFTYLEEGNRFQFTCYAVGLDSSKPSKKFQAEADEPLLAVRQVLDDLEAWQKAGTKSRTRILAERDRDLE